jgi:hypothetical protein
MAAYLTQPLTVACKDLDEIRRFLAGCRYVSDKEQFEVPDYWMPPEEFERRKRGDCECAALWAWRQLLGLGYEARFVVGDSGAFGHRHAWVTFQDGDQWYALEPFRAWLSPSMPRLHTLFYQPAVSASWDGERIHYYEHQSVRYLPRAPQVAALLMEATAYHMRYVLRIAWSRARRAVKRRVKSDP